MASNAAQRLISSITELPNGFDPEEAVRLIRGRLSDQDKEMHIVLDLVEGLWDEVQRLQRLVDMIQRNS